MIPFLENKKVWGLPYLKIENLQEIHFMFLIDMKFISKLLEMLFMDNLSFPDPHLHQNIFKNDILEISIKKKERDHLAI